jgi:hypothetical protein
MELDPLSNSSMKCLFNMQLYYYFVKKEQIESNDRNCVCACDFNTTTRLQHPHSTSTPPRDFNTTTRLQRHHSPKPMREGAEHSQGDEAQKDSITFSPYPPRSLHAPRQVVSICPRASSLRTSNCPRLPRTLTVLLLPPTPVSADL